MLPLLMSCSMALNMRLTSAWLASSAIAPNSKGATYRNHAHMHTHAMKGNKPTTHTDTISQNIRHVSEEIVNETSGFDFPSIKAVRQLLCHSVNAASLIAVSHPVCQAEGKVGIVLDACCGS